MGGTGLDGGGDYPLMLAEGDIPPYWPFICLGERVESTTTKVPDTSSDVVFSENREHTIINFNSKRQVPKNIHVSLFSCVCFLCES